MAEKDPVIRDLLRSGQKITAIKLYRQRNGSGLKEAKDAIEELEADDGITGYPSDADRWEQIADRTFRDMLEVQIRGGKRMAAIKLYREKYSQPLKYAKQMVLAWQRVLGMDDPPVADEGEETVETFDIRWNETVHPEKRFLFWKEAGAFVEFSFELQLGEQTAADTLPVSWRELVASTSKDGEYEIFVGDDDQYCCVEIVHLDRRTLWYDPEDRTHWHVFDEANYKATISRLRVTVLDLKQRHPDMPIKFKDDFNSP